MTPLQLVLYWIGFARVRRFRRWVGGRWILWCPYEAHHGRRTLRWEWDPNEPYLGFSHNRLVTVEVWNATTVPKTCVTQTRTLHLDR